MISEVYDALKEAGASEEKARKAAEAIAKELSRNNFPALSSVREALAFQTRGFKPLVPSAKPGGY